MKIKKIKAYEVCGVIYKKKEIAIASVIEELQTEFYNIIFDDHGNYRKYKSSKQMVKKTKKHLLACLKTITEIEKENQKDE